MGKQITISDSLARTLDLIRAERAGASYSDAIEYRLSALDDRALIGAHRDAMLSIGEGYGTVPEEVRGDLTRSVAHLLRWVSSTHLGGIE